MVDHTNVAHISSLSRSSPYLLISLFLLTWNIVFTLVGVNLHTEKRRMKPADETVTDKLEAYIISLVLFPTVCIVVLVAKCLCVCTTQESHHWCRKLVVMAMHDLVFLAMGTLYLAGDNLPILICSGTYNTGDKEDCIETSAIIVGFSLLLHAALYIAGSFKLNPAISTLPVTGRIRKAYQSILQLAALTILLDQTFTTVVKFITIVDIEMDESPACGCPGNTTNSASEREVAWFLTGLSSIILLIVIGIVVKNWKDYCSCCWKKRKSEIGQCLCHLLENSWIFSMYIVVVGFMVIYTLSDSRWLYKCTPVCNGDPTAVRLGLLVTSLVLSALWILIYLFIICLPGFGIVCQTKRLLHETDYVLVHAEKERHEWQCKNARKRKVNGENSAYLTNMIGKSMPSLMILEENYGSLSIDLPTEEEITCLQGVVYAWQGCYDVCCPNASKCTCCSTCCSKEYRHTQCLNSEDDTSCAQCLCQWFSKKCKAPWQSCKADWKCCKADWKCCKEVWICCKRRCSCCWGKCKPCWERLKDKFMETEDGGNIFLTYLGKNNNFTSNTLSQHRTLDMSDQVCEHPAGTDFYVILKPKK